MPGSRAGVRLHAFVRRHCANYLNRAISATAAWGLKGPHMIRLHPLDRLCLQRRVEHLHALGPRATAEFLVEVADRIGGMPCILGLLVEFEQRLSLDMVRAAGADRFPPRQLHAVPRDAA